MKKGTGLKEIIYEIIKTDFPNGYHISAKSDYEHMINKLNYIFDGEIQTAKTIHRLLAVIDRTDAILIDKGTYSAKENVIDLSENLSNKIILFLTKYLSRFHLYTRYQIIYNAIFCILMILSASYRVIYNRNGKFFENRAILSQENRVGVLHNFFM